MSRIFLTLTLPAVICRKEKDMARNILRSSAFEKVSSFVQATVMSVGFVVVMLREV